MKEKIKVIKNLISTEIQKQNISNINLMEVCGTHTMAIAKYAIKSMLPTNINIISGPGCPVCVTAATDIEMGIELASRSETIIATFGDMIKVPGRKKTLSEFGNVKIIYSPLDALALAQNTPNKEIVLLGIGFETTTPLIAATMLQAQKSALNNFSVLSMNKTVPAALEVILSSSDCKINGLLLPGHVSAVTGRNYFDFLSKFNAAGVISGFGPLEIMESIYLLVKMFSERKKEVINNHPQFVTEEGNQTAMKILFSVFEDADVDWRGIGIIPHSGLAIRKEFAQYDAKKKFKLHTTRIENPPHCLCGNILMGKARPNDCKLFGKACTPANPIGPCMVSSEGTCAAYYKYYL
ncbi:MAG: hydrogenase formation protein HypD [Bdellovibrionales bacterium RIFOXYD12_FULL_39_22]|nr:MAG: hydrogenase formation protein HypD [Bdellovibrionales bacterium RIFOXYB1_FULL_39_21]OFZ40726.1 MAG: hydrogenase formation protein HypD [Bdellovibrionales bacterium RIFOXYC12_FULL_39_17]OFZ48148.1 MAG: hydrogenase formation protein HypD [Bdellovibrionales bacterium RIFOXYC1_FULL_39_130]OFZ75798.1 MAG: hydrogenase formation protein HypD [Bdellovibrionales bacterium RIFOXYD1_FULL_39_84]OFZ91859.1 MAG: hydrogenase formation protein HypD [Bdellovibrionales bacterium RIFOXYD12_FULL_39_22]HLE